MEVLSRKIIQFSLSTILMPSVNCPTFLCITEGFFKIENVCDRCMKTPSLTSGRSITPWCRVTWVTSPLHCALAGASRGLQRAFYTSIRASNNPSVFTIRQRSTTLLLVERAYTSAFTLKTLLKHYAKQVPTKDGKQTWNQVPGEIIIMDTMLTDLPIPYDLCISILILCLLTVC